MIRIAVCDNDKNWRNLIINTITKCSDGLDFIVKEFEYASRLLLFCKEGECYDLILFDPEFADVNMEKFTKEIKNTSSSSIIIIITNSVDYIHIAFRNMVFQYLLKPIAKSEIEKDIKNAFFTLYQKRKRITIKSYQNVYEVDTDNIVFVETEMHHIRIHLNDFSFQCSGSLTEIYNRLKSLGFIRCSQSYVVNYKYINRLDKDVIWLTNGIKIYVSRGCKKEFLKQYLEHKNSAVLLIN